MSDPPVLALALDEAPSFRPLTPDALSAVQGASLRVLEETGVAVDSPTVRARLAEAGARVTGDRVRFPAAFVESAIRLAPRGYLLAARDPACDLPLDGRQVRAVLASHEVPALTDGVPGELDRILAAFAGEAWVE